MNLDSKPSTADPPNTSQVIDRDNEMGTTEKILEDHYETNIDHNHPNFHIIQEIVRE